MEGAGLVSPSISLSACLSRAESALCLGTRPPFPPSPMAVATDSPPPVHTPAIEDEYSGPKLEDGKVTITFMKELMQWYKDQKKLHRKCAYQVTHLSGAAHTCDPRIESISALAEPELCRGQLKEKGGDGS